MKNFPSVEINSQRFLRVIYATVQHKGFTLCYSLLHANLLQQQREKEIIYYELARELCLTPSWHNYRNKTLN